MDKTELIRQTAENELLQFLGVKIELATPERVVMTMEVFIAVRPGRLKVWVVSSTPSWMGIKVETAVA